MTREQKVDLLSAALRSALTTLDPELTSRMRLASRRFALPNGVDKGDAWEQLYDWHNHLADVESGDREYRKRQWRFDPKRRDSIRLSVESREERLVRWGVDDDDDVQAAN